MGSRAALLVAVLVLLAGCAGQGEPEPGPADSTGTPSSTAPAPPAPVEPGPSPEPTTAEAPQEPEVLATGLSLPWGVAFLPDDTALVTERDTGRVLELVPGEEPRELATVPDVDIQNEVGLLGIAVSPGYVDNGYVFVYYTTASDNRVLRMVHDDGELVPDVVVIEGIPRETYHSGGRIAFGPDGYLYVSTGDAAAPSIAQDPDSLGGKILRVDEEGKPAPGNPTEGSPVWSLGHRNVQGLGWDEQGRMFASEFGADDWDELNLIEPGANYGWPQVEGAGGGDEFVDPVEQWPPAQASPSGITVTDDAVYLAALRGQSLWRVPLDGGDPARLLEGEYGRLRDVVLAPDGRLWLLTSNTFRGEPTAQDDRIIAVGQDWLAKHG